MKRFALMFACAALSLFIVGCSCSQQETPEPAPTPEAQKVLVPNLVNLDSHDAQKLLANSGLVEGSVGYDYSDSVPNGLVMSQKPAAMEQVDLGTAVDVTISKGKQEPADATVPNLIGMSQQDAEKALRGAKLVAVQAKPVVSTAVEPGKVCEQSVPAGSTVKEGTQVTFAIAVASDLVAVPDELGKLKDDALADLQNAGLAADLSTAFSSTVEQNKVISQSVAAGTKVAKGTVVTLQISLGPQPAKKVAVPDIMTYTRDDAVAALQSAGLDYRYTGDNDGTVVSVDPAVGTEVEVGSTVSFVLQHESTLVAVPDVAGMSGADAQAELEAVGLDLDYDTDNPDKVLQGTNPVAGTEVDIASVVDAVYPPDPDPQVEVPDVAGMSGSDAEDAMDAVGLELDYDTDDPDKVLQGTDPAAGTKVDPASVVEAVYPPEPEPDQPVGAWTGNGTAAKSTLTKEEKQIFEDTMADAGKRGLSPVATLATQTVAGMNYAFLAQEGDSWCVVIANVDTDGTVSYQSHKDLDPGLAPTTKKWPTGTGAWEPNKACAGKLPKDAAAAFDAAMKGFTGPSVKPVALLATQPVAGTNYEVLCVADDGLYEAIVYQDASGTATIDQFGVFDLAACNK